MRAARIPPNSRRANPLLRQDLQRWRMRLVLACLLGGFLALGARAVWLQIGQTEFLNEQGDKRVNRVVAIPAHRGMITDRRGEPLAISTPVESLWVDPRHAEASPAQIQALASLLNLDPDALARTFADARRSFVYLRRQLPPDLAARALALGIPGLHSIPEYRRYYPAGEVIAQLVGITSAEDKGQEGLELAFESWLAGVPGTKRVVRDRLGNIIEELDLLREPKHGRDLTLSINLQMQYLAWRELAAALAEHQAKAGAVVVLDARSGEILALSSLPAYNPNNRASLRPERMRNRAVTDVFEPGSTMKPFLVASALEAGAVRPDVTIDTGPGYMMVGNKRISDVHPKGVLTLAQAIQVSSNVATAKIALDMKSEDYWRLLNRAGFGAPPGVGFPGEVGGRLRPYETWRPIEKATMAFGHGMSTTLLHLARAYTTFANGGVMPELTVLKRQEVASGRRVMSRETAESLLAMLETVTEPGGTAPRARVMGYRVGGKTGTAHKLVDGRYAPDKYIASFVGLAPVSDPRLVVAVMIDEPGGKVYYGGQVAAPVFAKVMAGALRFMALPPDAPIEDVPPPPLEVVGEMV